MGDSGTQILDTRTFTQSTLAHKGPGSFPPFLVQAYTPYYEHFGASNTMHTPCWTYGLIGRNKDEPGVIVFLLASTFWGLGHAAHLLVGAGPRGPNTDSD